MEETTTKAPTPTRTVMSTRMMRMTMRDILMRTADTEGMVATAVIPTVV